MTYHPEATDSDKGKAVEIDFTPPFKRFNMMKDLQTAMGVTFPELDLSSPGSFVFHSGFSYSESILYMVCRVFLRVCE